MIRNKLSGNILRHCTRIQSHAHRTTSITNSIRSADRKNVAPRDLIYQLSFFSTEPFGDDVRKQPWERI